MHGGMIETMHQGSSKDSTGDNDQSIGCDDRSSPSQQDCNV